VARTLADLKPGESGIIKGFLEPDLTPKLLEMGCLPGEQVKLLYPAPLGDPICIQVHGYDLAMRVNEAKSIIIE
jgi:ferrous iron transport protein A